MDNPIALVSRRSASSHHAILDAAVTVAAERGYFAASIEDIARQAGVGKQTIYRWWRAKPFLYLEVYQAPVPASELTIDTGSVRDDLSTLLTRLFALYRATPAGAILAGLIAEAQAKPDLARTLRAELIEKRQALLLKPLTRGLARGELALTVDIALTADLFVAAIWHRLLVAPERVDDGFADALIDALLGPERAQGPANDG